MRKNEICPDVIVVAFFFDKDYLMNNNYVET